MMLSLYFVLTSVLLAGEKPKVMGTYPVNGATAVDPHLTSISVTFNQKMLDGSWSWVQKSKDTFPEMAGKPSYDKEQKTCTLPVKVKSGVKYIISVNAPQFKNFKNEKGVSADPYIFSFTTSK